MPTISYEYPMIAVREILANAFCHRNYEDQSRHVHVRLFADRIEISSPGEWVGQAIDVSGPVELSTLCTESVRRNARLSSVLAWAGLVEEEGSGVPRAVDDCRSTGAPCPVMEQRSGFTIVTIWPRSGWRRPTKPESERGDKSERIDYSIERQRHEALVGREALLGRLDELLVADGTDRWVIVTGGPGMGKSALLAAWLARRERAGAVVPHHFIRRGQYDWDNPTKLVGSLIAQIEERFPNQNGLDANAQMHPASRLAATLTRISTRQLAPHGQRLVVLIDGLDEYDPPAGTDARDPLAAFLPHALPRGVSFLCSSRPRHPYINRLEERDGELVQIDLDDAHFAADNEATVRAFWERAAPSLGLDALFTTEAVARAGGNSQHAVLLRAQLAALRPEQRRVEEIPRGLSALLAGAWERVSIDPVVVEGLGILCAAREALTLHELGTVACWAGEAQQRAFMRGARELLIETQRVDSVPEYRLHHDSIRAHIAAAIGAAALRKNHGSLAKNLATWPAPKDTIARRYALRYALFHRAEAGELENAWRLAADMSFVETKCREFGVHEAEADVTWAAERCRASGEEALRERFVDLARALGRESRWLSSVPEAANALVWNRLRQFGWSEEDLFRQLQLPTDVTFLRARHVATRESPALVRDLVGHSNSVLACAMTPDGRRVVSASSDQTLKIWDLHSGQTLATLQGHSSSVNACAVTPDGHHVVSASDDKTLKIWDLHSGKTLATLQGHSSFVNACAVTPDGHHVVSASDDKTLKIWDLHSGQVIATLCSHAASVLACAVTPDGRNLVSASDDQTLKIWDLESCRELASLRGHAASVLACAVTPDGRRVVSASDDKTLKIWDLESRQNLTTLQGHAASVRACAVTPDGRRVISASDDQTLRVWDLESEQNLATLQGHFFAVNACAVTPDCRHMVSASYDKTLKIWDLGSRQILTTPQGHAASVLACAAPPNGHCVVSASDDHTLKIWDLPSGRLVATLANHSMGVNACALTPDSRRVISASNDRTLKIWDLKSRRLLSTLEGHTDKIRACAVTPDGHRVVSASDDQTLKVWSLESGETLSTLHGHFSRVRACALTADGRRLVSASDDHTLKVWDLESGRELTTLQGHSSPVRACAVTTDGRRVVSASDDQTLKVWDIESGQTIATFYGHSASVRACAVTTDGHRLVSASDDQTLKIWAVDSGTCILTHRGGASFVAVTATETSIVAGDAAGAVWFLDWPLSSRSEASHDASESRGNQRESTAEHAPVVQWPQRKQHTILFLAADPGGVHRLALDREARAIQVELERSGFRDRFELVTRWTANPVDLLQELLDLKPTVVHFSGRGVQSSVGNHLLNLAPYGDVGGSKHVHDLGHEPPGLYMQDPDGHPRIVSTQVLEKAFSAAGSSVKLVVLSACYSEVQAGELLAHVDCVIGMSASISDDAARSFAVGFYGGLGEGESVAVAYKQGCAALSLEGLRDAVHPKLLVRSGADARPLVLAGPPQASPVIESSANVIVTNPREVMSSPTAVDIGIVTSHDSEFRAVLDVFPNKAGIFRIANREYALRHADAGDGERYTIAVLRQAEKGHGEAQIIIKDLINDLAPRLVLVVGMAGGLPSNEVKLGDVVLSTRVHDFTVQARRSGQEAIYAATGGPVAKALAAAVANLPAREDELGDWAASLPTQPPVEWMKRGQLYGPLDWQNELRAKLEHHYGKHAKPRAPVYVAGPIASSNRLVKDPALLFSWLAAERSLLAVEMESGCVYHAVRERCPMLAIRGISDIVGLKRANTWAKFACASAAAFTRAFLRTRPVPVGVSVSVAVPHQEPPVFTAIDRA